MFADAQPSGGFRRLLKNEENSCQANPHCRPLRLLYPCLAGYVKNGNVDCSKKCVKTNNKGTVMSENGFCLLHNSKQMLVYSMAYPIHRENIERMQFFSFPKVDQSRWE